MARPESRPPSAREVLRGCEIVDTARSRTSHSLADAFARWMRRVSQLVLRPRFARSGGTAMVNWE